MIAKKIVAIVPVLVLPSLALASGGCPFSCLISDTTPLIWWLAPITSVIALYFAYVCYKFMMNSPKGNERMEEIASYVREGAYAYLFRQYKVVALVFVVLSGIFAVLSYYGIQNPFVPVAFLTGGFFSGLCGFLGMKSATSASPGFAMSSAFCSIRLSPGWHLTVTAGPHSLIPL